MATREELEEKAEECDAPEEYIECAREIVADLDDKEWAAELLEEGAEWAETYEDAATYAKAAKDIVGDDEVVSTFLENGKMKWFAGWGKGKEDSSERYLQVQGRWQGRCICRRWLDEYLLRAWGFGALKWSSAGAVRS